jgi:D-sedoheptulose 7-phosphate isomerase
MDRVTKHIQELGQILSQLPLEKIDQVITILHEARLRGRQVFLLGTGSSSSTASQFVVDLCSISRQAESPGFKAIGLAEHTLTSSFLQEEGNETLMLHQLESMLARMDVVIAFSLNGNTKPLLRAVELANRRGATTIGFTGCDGGRLSSLVDVNVLVPGNSVEHIEDVHLILENLITLVLREEAQQVSTPRWLEQPLLKSLSALKSTTRTNLPSAVSPELTVSERSRASLEMFSEISRELASEMKLHDVLGRVLKLTQERLSAASGTIVVVNERGEVMDGALAYHGEMRPFSPQEYMEIVQHGLAGWVLHNRQPALISNTRDDPRWFPRPWEDQMSGARSAICVPLMEEERAIGVLTLVANQIESFSEKDLSLLAAVAMFISLVNYDL